MKSKEEFFEEAREKDRKRQEKQEEEMRQVYLEETKDWNIEKLRERYIDVQLARTFWAPGISPGLAWDLFHEECMFCGFEYVDGHDSCCDDCWEKNKDKTLEELEDDGMEFDFNE